MFDFKTRCPAQLEKGTWTGFETAVEDVATDTSDLVPPRFGKPASTFYKDMLKVQLYLLRHSSKLDVSRVYARFPRVDGATILTLWKGTKENKRRKEKKKRLNARKKKELEDAELLKALASILDWKLKGFLVGQFRISFCFVDVGQNFIIGFLGRFSLLALLIHSNLCFRGHSLTNNCSLMLNSE